MTLGVQPPNFKYCRAADKMNLNHPPAPFGKISHLRFHGRKGKGFILESNQQLCYQHFTPGHHTSRVMPPYTPFSLQGPFTGQHTSVLSGTGHLFKRCAQKTLSIDDSFLFLGLAPELQLQTYFLLEKQWRGTSWK